MTQKEAYIKNREKQLEKLRLKLSKIAEKAKKKKKSEKVKYFSEINKVRRKFMTAQKRLQKLSQADVIQWEARRKKLRDSLCEIRGMLDRLSIKVK